MWIRFNDIVITGNGEYRTRKGYKAVVYETKLLMSYPTYGMNPDGSKSNQGLHYQVNAYGYIHVPTKSGKVKQVWTSWFINGKIGAIGTYSNDLICKVAEGN